MVAFVMVATWPACIVEPAKDKPKMARALMLSARNFIARFLDDVFLREVFREFKSFLKD